MVQRITNTISTTKEIIHIRYVANYQHIDVQHNDRPGITRSPDGFRLPGRSGPTSVRSEKLIRPKDTRGRKRQRGGRKNREAEEERECTWRLRKLSRRCVFTRRFTSGQRAFDLRARAPVATLKRLKGFSRWNMQQDAPGPLGRIHRASSRPRYVRSSRASVYIRTYACQWAVLRYQRNKSIPPRSRRNICVKGCWSTR